MYHYSMPLPVGIIGEAAGVGDWAVEVRVGTTGLSRRAALLVTVTTGAYSALSRRPCGSLLPRVLHAQACSASGCGLHRLGSDLSVKCIYTTVGRGHSGNFFNLANDSVWDSRHPWLCRISCRGPSGAILKFSVQSHANRKVVKETSLVLTDVRKLAGSESFPPWKPLQVQVGREVAAVAASWLS